VTDTEFRAWTAGVSAFVPRRRFRLSDSERLEWEPRDPAQSEVVDGVASPRARASITD
jgi:hypothetical protein